MSRETAGRERRRLSRRQSRSLIAGLVSLLLLVAVGALAFVRRAPARYDPSQAAEGITSELARRIPAGRPHVSFGDAASSSGLVFTHFSGERSTQLPEDMGSGAAWGDIDNDGDDDLFIVNVSGALPTSGGPGGAGRSGTGATSRLFRNDAGRFVDVTEPAGLVREILRDGGRVGRRRRRRMARPCRHVLRPAVSVSQPRRRHVREPNGIERPRRVRRVLDGASWADYDRDGDLDLYICGYVRYRFDPIGAGRVTLQGEAESPFTLNPASYLPERNLLLRNDGAGRFVDVAARAGVDNTAGRSLSAAWCDFDGDGRLDLYVANDVSDNALFRNRGNGRFENVSHAAWVADPRGAMGLAVGDWDLDGDFDIFVTHWLAQENALFSNLRIMARGEPPDRMVFMDIADQTGLGQISLDYVKWGTAFFDYDNDGRPDLLSINGSTFQDPANPRRLLPMRHQLFWNRGEREGFFDVAPVSGAPLNEPTVGRGAAVSDYDGDGDVDVLVVNHGGAARLLRNDGGNARRWLKVRVRGRQNRFGFGALVSVTAGGATQQQQVGSQPSYLSQHSLTLHFGLGDQPHADEIVVRFPGGVEVRQTAVRANQTITVEEPGR